MDCLSPAFALTGDPEIDAACPSHPRLLAEAAVAAVDGARIMLVGGMAAPILRRRIGSLDVIAYLRELDGTRSLAQLCADDLPTAPDRRKLLFTLLRHGLLEQGTAAPAGAVEPATEAFLAKVMDQTRIHHRRDDVAKAFRQPVAILGATSFCRELECTLKAAGLDAHAGDVDSPASCLTIAVLDADAAQDSSVDRLQSDGRQVLLVCPRGRELDVGPLLPNRGSCTTACYRASCGDDAHGLDPATRGLWLATLCNVIVLLNSGTSPLALVNNFIRYRLDCGQLHTIHRPVPRRHVAAIPPVAIAAPQEPAGMQRVARHSGVAVPPRRLVGVKSHEVHYAPQNIAAAKYFPLAHGDPATAMSMVGARPEQRLLLQLIIRSFGFWADDGGMPRRICPSGGNLGSAECLVVWQDRARGRDRLLRYVPIADQLEPIASAPLSGDADAPEFEILGLCNSEKAQHKYFDFGLSLAFLDAGVAAAFLDAAAQVAGCALAFRYDQGAQDWLRELLTHRGHCYQLAWRVGLPDGIQAPANWDEFDGLLRQRKAWRACPRLDLDASQLAAMLQAARPRAMGASAQLLACLRPILVLEQDGRCTTYEWAADVGLRRCAGSSLGCDSPGQQLLSQCNLSRAAGRLFMLADLPLVLCTQGSAGHDHLLTLVGQWIGSFWLAIERRQLRGCPAGATVESDLLGHLPPAYAHLFNVFAFTFGNPQETEPCRP